jgi:hypothetical protein
MIVVAGAPGGSEQLPPHRHGGPTLFVVQAAANKLQPSGSSSASATGGFVLDPQKFTLSYDLTYHGLENGGPRSIALHNFGEGGNGPRIRTICGEGGSPCPSAPSATVTGLLEGGGQGTPIDSKLLVEFATGRMYVEVVGGDGRPEIRGQLEPNNAMVPVRNFVANLTAVAKGSGTGTAVLSEIHFADGRVGVFYRVTVAGTSGAPQAVSLSGVPDTDRPAAQPTAALAPRALPQPRVLPSKAATPGGTLTGEYQVRPNSTDAPLATRMLAANAKDVSIAVRTTRFPNGELQGVFRPVQ